MSAIYPDAHLLECVDVLSGSLSFSTTDLVVDSASPLNVTRYYTSSGVDYGGWTLFPHLQASSYQSAESSEIRITEPSGVSVRHVHDKKSDSYIAAPDRFCTNLSQVELNGKSNPMNNKVEFTNNFQSILVTLPDGGSRFYTRKNPENLTFMLEEEILPTKRKIIYKYDNFGRLAVVKTTNPSGTKTYSTLQFDRPKQREKPQFNVFTSDGQVVEYKCHPKDERLIIGHIQNTSKPFSYLNYQADGKGLGPIVKDLIEGNELIFSAQFFVPNDGTIKKKNVKDLRCNRVRTLSAPLGPGGELIPVYSFTYHLGASKGLGLAEPGRTEVRDAQGILTCYHFSPHYILEKIERFGKDDMLHTQETLEWQEGYLIKKTLSDSKGNPFFSRSFAYDHIGNITKETFTGDLEGIGQESSYSKTYEYIGVFPTLIKEDNGYTVEIEYLQGTDLPTKKTLKDHDEILQRVFSKYDADNFLIEEITDYGTGSDQKSIQRITRNEQTSLPEIIEDFYWDDGEKLLQKKTFTYSPKNQILKETTFDSENKEAYTLFFTYDPSGRLLSKTDPLGRVFEYKYNEQGRVAFEKAPSISYEHTYDLAGRITSTKEIDLEGNARVTTTQYDLKGNPIAVRDKNGHLTRHEYDPFGGRAKTFLQTTSLDPTLKMSYDGQGNLIEASGPTGAITKTTYNAYRSPVHTTYPDGAQTTNRYYKNGLLPCTIDAEGIETHLFYDALGRMTKKITANLSTETWEYNGGHLLSYRDPLGITTSYSYDKAGRKIEEIRGSKKITYTYDSLNNLASTTDHSLKLTHHQKTDLAGRVIEEWDEDFLGKKEHHRLTYYSSSDQKEKIIRNEAIDTFCYDGRGRLTQHTDPLQVVTQYKYDDNFINDLDQKVTKKTTLDPEGNQTIEIQDIEGRVVVSEKWDGASNLLSRDEITYNETGHRTKITHLPELRTLQWEYDPIGRVISQQEELDKVTHYKYDQKGRQICKIKPDGVEIHYKYDSLDRLIELYSTDQTVHYKYHYHKGSLISTVFDLISHLSFTKEYDKNLNLVSESNPLQGAIQRQYDKAGRCTLLILPDQSTISYGYTGPHLTSVKRGHYEHNYTLFDYEGHVEKEELICNLGEIYTPHDLLERPTLQKSPFHNWELTFNTRGLLIHQTSSLSDQKTFTYDPLSQLTQEDNKTYNFDSLGNPSNSEINCLNQILSKDTIQYKYDQNGNLTEQISPSQTTRYTYDALDRLISINSPSKTIHYSYDPYDRLLTKTTPHTTSIYLYDRDFDIGTMTPSRKITELKILGLGIHGDIGAAIALELEGELYVPLHDHRGNIIALISPTQNKITETYLYSAYGEENPHPTSNPWRYCSKRQEDDLIFFGRRFYSPALSRWLTPDPSGYSDGINLYTYILNDPINRLDLFGLSSDGYYPCSPFGTSDIYGGVPIPFICPKFDFSAPSFLNMENFGAVVANFMIHGEKVHQLSFSTQEAHGKLTELNTLFNNIPKDQGRILFISTSNGIDNSRNDILKNAQHRNKTFKGEVFTIEHYNVTSNGLSKLSDLRRLGDEILGYDTPGTIRLRQELVFFSTLLDLTFPEGLFVKILHSESSIGYNNAVKYMKPEDQESVRRHVLAIAVGPVDPIPKNNAKEAINICSEQDRAARHFLDRHNREISLYNNPDYDIRLVPAITPKKDQSCIAGDHSFLGETYKFHSEKVLKDFDKDYRFIRYNKR